MQTSTARPWPPRTEAARWQAVASRDARADGTFYYCVRTTGVYCRPSCPSRRPRPENVVFHSTRADAESAGFRPCRRCTPERPSLAQRQAALIAAACRRIEAADQPPSLRTLAAEANLSPYYFHRLFTRTVGLTPRGYASAERAQRIRARLRGERSVTDAVYAAGFGSSGGFYASATQALGMTPSAYRDGGRNLRVRFAASASSLGTVLVAATAQGICAILLGDDRDSLLQDLHERFPHAILAPGDGGFSRLVARVVALVEHPGICADLPLDIRGTAFQQRVWQALRRIPAGSTASYGAIARALGVPGGARAVARACAANPVAVAIPCHRVVRADGSSSGYRWGAARKRELLRRERGTGRPD